MVKCNIKENLNSVFTGDDFPEKHLYNQLKMSIEKADKIDIVVSFLMVSGVKMILKELKNAVERGVNIRLLTGNYLGITQPEALYLIKNEFGDDIDLRFYNVKGKSFHPKAYIFHYNDEKEIYIGSSNLSRSALTSGIEWNYRLTSSIDNTSVEEFYETFENLFEKHSVVIDDQELKNYAKSWVKPNLYKNFVASESLRVMEDNNITDIFQPRGAQIEALYSLNATREEGATKALVHAATGVGKTYLAAFDSKPYEKVLFVAHREEILKQAAQSFRNVRKSEDYGFFMGSDKTNDKSVIFASVQSLGKDSYLNKKFFDREYFDYIVVDEFHHAVSSQYKKIIDYFKPKFMLGLTATPERMDGRSIYQLCDYNVPYEITLKDAINRDLLVPFHYYGIYDDTDYSKIHLVKGRYDEKELNETYIGNVVRYDLIYRHYMKYPTKRAFGFCCSRKHAEDMSREFNERGIKSVAVYSNAEGEFAEERAVAIDKLKKGEINVIFSVDMFNEGVDIPEVDLVMFLRPTESPIVFLQQLGRGLRKYENKEFLNVLDFIGNYTRAGRAPFYLSGESYDNERIVKGHTREFEFPEGCLVDFDLKLIDLFKEMAQRGLTVRERISLEYDRVKELLGRVPTRIELFDNMDDEIYQLCRNKAKENPFKDYLGYLESKGDLDTEEMDLYDTYGRELINLIENTSMSKSYKMPILNSFYNNGDVKMELSEEDIVASWKAFYGQGTNWKDITGANSYDEYLAISDKDHLKNAVKNPVKFLKKSGQGYFIDKEGFVIALKDELKTVVKSDAFAAHMKDAIEYRTTEYYKTRYDSTNRNDI